VGALNGVEARYAVTGSHASTLYGEQRFTNDIDVLVDLPLSRLRLFLSYFPPDQDYYVSEDAARDAILHRRQFNIIHSTSGLKIDFILPATPFDEASLNRTHRRKATPDLEIQLLSPEDLIIKKLEFHREGGSEKHLRDIGGMLDLSAERIDLARVEKLAAEFDVLEDWHTVLGKWKSARKNQGKP
jgi:hypothetical protein